MLEGVRSQPKRNIQHLKMRTARRFRQLARRDGPNPGQSIEPEIPQTDIGLLDHLWFQVLDRGSGIEAWLRKHQDQQPPYPLARVERWAEHLIVENKNVDRGLELLEHLYQEYPEKGGLETFTAPPIYCGGEFVAFKLYPGKQNVRRA